MRKCQITLVGTNGLLMHNSRLANPLDPATKNLKAATSKRKKTDDDLIEISRLEYIGGMYFDSEIGPYLPADNIHRCMVDAAKKYKLGKKFTEGVVLQTDVNPIAYEGPRTLEDLWADDNFRFSSSVKVGMSRVMRTRPYFREWMTEATAIFDPNVIDFSEIEQIAETAGQLIGIGDWRPRYGRFIATVVEVKA